MDRMQRWVQEWRRRVQLYVTFVPEMSSYFQHDSAWKCLQEEVKELRDAETLPDIAKEMADVLVTLFGLACCYGIDLEPVFEAVMAANDLKTGDKDATGKVLKGPNYIAPDIAKVLRAQGWDG